VEREPGRRQLAPLTELTERPPAWRPDWPLRVWLIPLATAVAAPVVTYETTGTSKNITISTAAWSLILITASLAAFFAYVFSESRARLVVALVAGAVALGVTVGVVGLAGYLFWARHGSF
jgi:hypothetical protein